MRRAKGNTRKVGRKRLAAQLDAMEIAASQLAELLAAAPAEGEDPFAPPAFLNERYPEALEVWRTYAPELGRTWRLQLLHRPTFALFCTYMAEWVKASAAIAEGGYTQRVKTIAGGYMERRRPEVDRRQRAFEAAMELATHFGLTPHDEYALFRDQRVAAANNPSLFSPATPDRDGQPTGELKPPGKPN